MTRTSYPGCGGSREYFRDAYLRRRPSVFYARIIAVLGVCIAASVIISAINYRPGAVPECVIPADFCDAPDFFNLFECRKKSHRLYTGCGSRVIEKKRACVKKTQGVPGHETAVGLSFPEFNTANANTRRRPFCFFVCCCGLSETGAF